MYMNSHYKCKTAVWPSYLYNRDSCTGKTTYLYQVAPLGVFHFYVDLASPTQEMTFLDVITHKLEEWAITGLDINLVPVSTKPLFKPMLIYRRQDHTG